MQVMGMKKTARALTAPIPSMASMMPAPSATSTLLPKKNPVPARNSVQK
jgi:hypothetical protein